MGEQVEEASGAVIVEASNDLVSVSKRVVCNFDALNNELSVNTDKAELVLRIHPEVRTEFLIYLVEKGRLLGYERISISTTGSGHGWTLYPPGMQAGKCGVPAFYPANLE
jgi:hypothetical protein